jgi:hypothetical protein
MDHVENTASKLVHWCVLGICFLATDVVSSLLCYLLLVSCWPVTLAARSKAWAVFACLKTGIVGSNPTRGMDVCVRLFYVCVVLCTGSGLATGWSPIQGVLPTVCRINKLKNGQGPKGCRAIERERESYCGTAPLVQLELAHLPFTLPLKNDLLSDPYSFHCSPYS